MKHWLPFLMTLMGWMLVWPYWQVQYYINVSIITFYPFHHLPSSLNVYYSWPFLDYSRSGWVQHDWSSQYTYYLVYCFFFFLSYWFCLQDLITEVEGVFYPSRVLRISHWHFCLAESISLIFFSSFKIYLLVPSTIRSSSVTENL